MSPEQWLRETLEPLAPDRVYRGRGHHGIEGQYMVFEVTGTERRKYLNAAPGGVERFESEEFVGSATFELEIVCAGRTAEARQLLGVQVVNTLDGLAATADAGRVSVAAFVGSERDESVDSDGAELPFPLRVVPVTLHWKRAAA